jgi:putative membrane protein
MKLLLCISTTLALAIAAPAHSNETPRGAEPSSDARPDRTGDRELTAQTFLTKAAMSGMAEVELGELAVRQSASSAVREYGRQMIADHGKANGEIAALAADKSVKLPTALDAEHAAIRDRLAGLNGTAFDRSYADVMVDSHGKAVALFEDAANLQDPAVAEFAKQQLPTLRLHGTHAERLQSSQ